MIQRGAVTKSIQPDGSGGHRPETRPRPRLEKWFRALGTYSPLIAAKLARRRAAVRIGTGSRTGRVTSGQQP